MARQTDDHANEGPWDPPRLSPIMASRQVDVSSPRGRDAETGHVRDFASLANLESPVMQPLSRRPTIESSRRTVSPPNSVKAFANARRRGQDADVHDARPGRRQLGDPNDEKEDTGPEKRTGGGPPRSVISRLDVPDVQRTYDRVAVVKFLGETSKRENPRDGLDIDFECLQTLIDSEDRDRFADPDFGNLPDSSIPTVVPMFTSDGDYIDMPSEPVSDSGDKETGAHGRPPPTRPRIVHQGEQSRFNFFSSALESTIHAAEFGDLVLPEENIRSLFDLPPEGESDGVWWLNMNSPSGSEVWTICKAFGIHPLTIEDIIHKESREKIELFPSYYFACFRSFTVVEEDGEIDYHPFNVYVVVFKEGIISFSFTSNMHASRVRFRISQLKEQVSLSSDWICYALM
ncbi:CorA-like Mg2+ transporter [Colletotrichum higginsianum]|uniref:CorA-like Mg2+ transporter n=1 Tax=Colletotrichum higginsianum (strain IMI 349063) TaxID=759273 RepID=H1UXJ8_COLHI|nr:CorA-like Mg2+ transporter [Colletotrichum higginsianum]